MHPQTPSQNNESIITRFLRGYWRRTDERLQNPKTLLESMRRCFCSNYAEPSGGVTQICPQAVIVNLSRTLCDMRRDTLKLRVVPLIKLLSSCRKKSLFLQYSARVEQSWKRKGALLLLCISSFCQLCHSHLHRFWFVMWFSYISSVTHHPYNLRYFGLDRGGRQTDRAAFSCMAEGIVVPRWWTIQLLGRVLHHEVHICGLKCRKRWLWWPPQFPSSNI